METSPKRGFTLAHANLLLLGDAPEGIADLFWALADGIEQALRGAGRSIASINERGLKEHPHRTFMQYLRTVKAALGEDRRILAVDELNSSSAGSTTARSRGTR